MCVGVRMVMVWLCVRDCVGVNECMVISIYNILFYFISYHLFEHLVYPFVFVCVCVVFFV